MKMKTRTKSFRSKTAQRSGSETDALLTLLSRLSTLSCDFASASRKAVSTPSQDSARLRRYVAPRYPPRPGTLERVSTPRIHPHVPPPATPPDRRLVSCSTTTKQNAAAPLQRAAAGRPPLIVLPHSPYLTTAKRRGGGAKMSLVWPGTMLFMVFGAIASVLAFFAFSKPSKQNDRRCAPGQWLRGALCARRVGSWTECLGASGRGIRGPGGLGRLWQAGRARGPRPGAVGPTSTLR